MLPFCLTALNLGVASESASVRHPAPTALPHFPTPQWSMQNSCISHAASCHRPLGRESSCWASLHQQGPWHSSEPSYGCDCRIQSGPRLHCPTPLEWHLSSRTTAYTSVAVALMLDCSSTNAQLRLFVLPFPSSMALF